MYELFEQLVQKRGITMYRVSKDLGIPQSNFADWKKGKFTPKVERLQKIADYFDVPLDYFYGQKEKAPAEAEAVLVNNDPELTEYLEQLKNRPEMRMLFSLTKSATKEDVEKAVKIIEAYLK